MAIRSIQSSTISFGLVNIPVKVYSSGVSDSRISFNQLHADKKIRLKQQMIDPETGEAVPKENIVKGYEFAKGQYVVVSEEELSALEAASDKQMTLAEFVPADSIAPVYLDALYYLGPDKGAEKAFHLLAAALRETKRVAVVQYVARGKEHVAVVRPLGNGLALQNLRYADEVRDQSEVPVPEASVSTTEVDLAKQIIAAQSSETFDPKKYRDEYQAKLRNLIDAKVKGEAFSLPVAPKAPPAPATDLVSMLKASLAAKAPKPTSIATPAAASAAAAPTPKTKKKAG